MKTGRLDQAINEFEHVLKMVPGEPYAILYLGMAYLNKEELSKAMETWKKYKNVRAPLVEKEIKPSDDPAADCPKPAGCKDCPGT